MDTARFTIKVVAERTGVPVHTLRAWERRYGTPSPHRGMDNRYRLYDDQDIADVLFLKHQVESGISPSQASLLLRQRQNRPAADATANPAQPLASSRAALIEAFAQSDERAARQVLDESFALYSPEQVASHIIEPTLKDIGEHWMRNEMTVWQEHLASNVVQQKLFAILQSQPAPPASAPLLAAACAPGEEHQIGLVILALMARRQGWRVAYLGQATPLGDLVHFARTSRPDVIIVSVTTPIGLAGLIPWLEPANRPDAPMVFGGRMPDLLPDLRVHLPGEYLGEHAHDVVQRLMLVRTQSELWCPSRRATSLAAVLQADRLGIASQVVSEFVQALPRAQRGWTPTDLHYATLFLLDSLACAVAFATPSLLDLQREWLKAMLPARQVPHELIVKHIEVVEAQLRKRLSKGESVSLSPLLERVKSPDSKS